MGYLKKPWVPVVFFLPQGDHLILEMLILLFLMGMLRWICPLTQDSHKCVGLGWDSRSLKLVKSQHPGWGYGISNKYLSFEVLQCHKTKSYNM